jgi:hypothetical protein
MKKHAVKLALGLLVVVAFGTIALGAGTQARRGQAAPATPAAPAAQNADDGAMPCGNCQCACMQDGSCQGMGQGMGMGRGMGMGMMGQGMGRMGMGRGMGMGMGMGRMGGRMRRQP